MTVVVVDCFDDFGDEYVGVPSLSQSLFEHVDGCGEGFFGCICTCVTYTFASYDGLENIAGVCGRKVQVLI